MRQLIRRFLTCDRGAGLVEYGLLIALVALGLIGGVRLYRGAVGGLTTRAAVTITHHSNRGYAGGAYRGGGVIVTTPSPATPAEPDPEEEDPEDPESSDSTVAAGVIKFGY